MCNSTVLKFSMAEGKNKFYIDNLSFTNSYETIADKSEIYMCGLVEAQLIYATFWA